MAFQGFNYGKRIGLVGVEGGSSSPDPDIPLQVPPQSGQSSIGFNFGKRIGLVGVEQPNSSSLQAYQSPEQYPLFNPLGTALPDALPPIQGDRRKEVIWVDGQGCPDGYEILGTKDYMERGGSDIEPTPVHLVYIGCKTPIGTHGGYGGGIDIGAGPYVGDPGSSGGTRGRDDRDVPSTAPSWASNLWTNASKLNIWDSLLPPEAQEKKLIIDALKDIVQFDCLNNIPELAACLSNMLNFNSSPGIRIGTARDNTYATRPKKEDICKAGAAYKYKIGVIFICPDLYKPGQEKALRSALIHELLHACLKTENEFDVELIEQYCYPEKSGVNYEDYIDKIQPIFGGQNQYTDWSELKGCIDYAGNIVFVSDGTIWNPRTGEVWLNDGTKVTPIRGKKILPKGSYNPFKIDPKDKEQYGKYYPDNVVDLIIKSGCRMTGKISPADGNNVDYYGYK